MLDEYSNKYFECKSPVLKCFLKQNGANYINKFKDYKDEKTIWLFEKNKLVVELLIEWQIRKDLNFKYKEM